MAQAEGGGLGHPRHFPQAPVGVRGLKTTEFALFHFEKVGVDVSGVEKDLDQRDLMSCSCFNERLNLLPAGRQ